jgi:hypothetical protein
MTTPSALSKLASQLFLDAQPPLILGGEYAFLNFGIPIQTDIGD